MNERRLQQIVIGLFSFFCLLMIKSIFIYFAAFITTQFDS
jgi:hypothetical protein